MVGGGDKDHSHCFSLTTDSNGEHQGRVFLFNTTNAMDCVKWVEAIRKHAGQVVKKKGGGGPPIMSQLEMARLNMKRDAMNIISQENVPKLRGDILMRSGYTFGPWYGRHAIVTDKAILIFDDENLNKCCCVLMLEGATIEKNIGVLEGEEKNGRGVFGVLTPLSHVCFDAGSEEAKIEWIGTISTYITEPAKNSV